MIILEPPGNKKLIVAQNKAASHNTHSGLVLCQVHPVENWDGSREGHSHCSRWLCSGPTLAHCKFMTDMLGQQQEEGGERMGTWGDEM